MANAPGGGRGGADPAQSGSLLPAGGLAERRGVVPPVLPPKEQRLSEAAGQGAPRPPSASGSALAPLVQGRWAAQGESTAADVIRSGDSASRAGSSPVGLPIEPGQLQPAKPSAHGPAAAAAGASSRNAFAAGLRAPASSGRASAGAAARSRSSGAMVHSPASQAIGPLRRGGSQGASLFKIAHRRVSSGAAAPQSSAKATPERLLHSPTASPSSQGGADSAGARLPAHPLGGSPAAAPAASAGSLLLSEPVELSALPPPIPGLGHAPLGASPGASSPTPLSVPDGQGRSLSPVLESPSPRTGEAERIVEALGAFPALKPCIEAMGGAPLSGTAAARRRQMRRRRSRALSTTDELSELGHSSSDEHADDDGSRRRSQDGGSEGSGSRAGNSREVAAHQPACTPAASDRAHGPPSGEAASSPSRDAQREASSGEADDASRAHPRLSERRHKGSKTPGTDRSSASGSASFSGSSGTGRRKSRTASTAPKAMPPVPRVVDATHLLWGGRSSRAGLFSGSDWIADAGPDAARASGVAVAAAAAALSPGPRLAPRGLSTPSPGPGSAMVWADVDDVLHRSGAFQAAGAVGRVGSRRSAGHPETLDDLMAMGMGSSPFGSRAASLGESQGSSLSGREFDQKPQRSSPRPAPLSGPVMLMGAAARTTPPLRSLAPAGAATAGELDFEGSPLPPRAESASRSSAGALLGRSASLPDHGGVPGASPQMAARPFGASPAQRSPDEAAPASLLQRVLMDGATRSLGSAKGRRRRRQRFSIDSASNSSRGKPARHGSEDQGRSGDSATGLLPWLEDGSSLASSQEGGESGDPSEHALQRRRVRLRMSQIGSPSDRSSVSGSSQRGTGATESRNADTPRTGSPSGRSDSLAGSASSGGSERQGRPLTNNSVHLKE